MPPQDDAAENVISFGSYRLLRRERQLVRGGVVLEIGDRAFDVLLALIDAPGKTIGKAELMAQAWSGRAVGENALQAQIAALRRVFGADRDLVLTISGRGYQFTGRLGDAAAPAPALAGPHSSALPPPRAEVFGRERALAELARLVREARFVTIVGAGGVGKTVLGHEIARRLAGEFRGGVQVANLTGADAPRELRALIDTASRNAGGGASPAAPRLLLLDGCEACLDAAAEEGERALRDQLALHLIATSREALRGEGETLYRLGPLALADAGTADAVAADSRDPADAADPAHANAADPAVALFIARYAAAAGPAPTDAALRAAARQICAALDGLPLAIEMAAARAARVGVDWVIAHLDQALGWLAHPARNASPQHRDWRACVAWSCDALAPPERWMLRRAAEFDTPFTLAQACDLLARDRIDAADVLDRLGALVDKSLIELHAAPAGTQAPRYRLLRLTRAHAREAEWPRA